MREYLHIFILMDSLNVQKTSEKLTSIFQARYKRVRQVFTSMEDFLTVRFILGPQLLACFLATSVYLWIN